MYSFFPETGYVERIKITSQNDEEEEWEHIQMNENLMEYMDHGAFMFPVTEIPCEYGARYPDAIFVFGSKQTEVAIYSHKFKSYKKQRMPKYFELIDYKKYLDQNEEYDDHLSQHEFRKLEPALPFSVL